MSPVTAVSMSFSPSSWTVWPPLADDAGDGLAHVAGADDGEVCHGVLLAVEVIGCCFN